MKVSIIIPCYNDGQYLRQAVGSALAQAGADIEVIVVNDGSDDAFTLEELASLSADGVRVVDVQHGGPAHARNAGIHFATGKYILPLDADDWIEPAYAANAAAVLDSRKDVGIVTCLADRFGDAIGLWELPEYSLIGMLTGNLVFVTSLFRKSDWQLVGGFSERMMSGLEDYDFFLSLIELGRGVVRLPEVLFHYRIHDNSRSRRMHADIECTLDMYDHVFDRHRALYEQNAKAVTRAFREMLQMREDAIRALEAEVRVQKVLVATPPKALGMREMLHYLRIWFRQKTALLFHTGR